MVRSPCSGVPGFIVGLFTCIEGISTLQIRLTKNKQCCEATLPYGSKYATIIYFPASCTTITSTKIPSTKLLGTWTLKDKQPCQLLPANLRSNLVGPKALPTQCPKSLHKLWWILHLLVVAGLAKAKSKCLGCRLLFFTPSRPLEVMYCHIFL